MVVPRVHEHEPARIVHHIASTHTEEHIYRARGRRCARWPHVYTENRDLSPETLSMAVKMCIASLAARQWLKLQRWVGPASLLHTHGWRGVQAHRGGAARGVQARAVGAALPTIHTKIAHSRGEATGPRPTAPHLFTHDPGRIEHHSASPRTGEHSYRARGRRGVRIYIVYSKTTILKPLTAENKRSLAVGLVKLPAWQR